MRNKEQPSLWSRLTALDEQLGKKMADSEVWAYKAVIALWDKTTLGFTKNRDWQPVDLGDPEPISAPGQDGESVDEFLARTSRLDLEEWVQAALKSDNDAVNIAGMISWLKLEYRRAAETLRQVDVYVARALWTMLTRLESGRQIRERQRHQRQITNVKLEQPQPPPIVPQSVGEVIRVTVTGKLKNPVRWDDTWGKQN